MILCRNNRSLLRLLNNRQNASARYRPRCEALETRCLPSVFAFSTGNPDGKIAIASRPATGPLFEIESADDFVLGQETVLNQATFTGLVPLGSTVNQVVIEIYRVFPRDSDLARTSGAPIFSTSQVPTRVNSPADDVFQFRDSAAPNDLTFSESVLSASFTTLNSVAPGGIHPKPNQTTGGNGPVTGEEVRFSVTFTTPIDLPAGHYFFVPQVALNTGTFFWLSAPKPIVSPGTPFSPDLQAWTRDANLAPDWLRVGTDIVGGAPAPQFNMTFSLSGHTAVSHLLAVGADLGGGPEVKAYNPATGELQFDFLAYEPSFSGGVRVAVADINGDGVPDIITAPGGVKVTLVNVNGALVPEFDLSRGRAPEIKVFSGANGSVIDDFLAYPSSFTAGVFVAVGDVNADGKPDIIVGPEATGQAGHTNVRVFFNQHLINTGGPLTPDREFNAYDPGFGGGVRVATADFNADGFADIVTSPGIFSGPDVRIFDGKTLTGSAFGSIIGEFLAYNPKYFGGVFVSTGDLNGDKHPDIVTGTNGNGGPEVKGFSGANILGNPTPAILDDFFAYDPNFNGGARVAVLDVNGDGNADIITGAGPGGGPHVRIFDGTTGLQLQNAQDSFFAFDVLFSGGVFVGAG